MKIRTGFVSNSSSSSFLCLGVNKSNIIEQLIKAEGLKKNIDGYYDNEGYGLLEARNVVFYGNSEDWIAAGLGEEETQKILENNTLKEARKIFIRLIKDRLGVDINEKWVDLFYGEAHSE